MEHLVLKARQRSGRATAEQYSLMLDFFMANKGLAEGKFIALHGREMANKKWEELTLILNGARGTQKSSAQWQSAWRDLKSRTSVKARERRKERAATGGKPLSSTQLNDIELRVLDIIGMQYVEGSKNCADSLPEEERLQVSLEAGHDEILYQIPTVPYIQEDIIINNSMVIVDAVEATEAQKAVEATEAPSENADKTAEVVEVEKESTSANKRKRAQPRKRSIFDSAREQFSAIAKQQADAMTMQAEAAKKQAEAALLQAQAFDRVAVALENLAYAIRPLVEATFSANRTVD